MYKKLLYLETEQKSALEGIQKKVKMNNGQVSVMRLIKDSINIFLDYYQEEAIEKYSGNYAKNS
jgi:hypothetical protein